MSRESGSAHTTILTAEFDDPEQARRIERSLRPEIGAIDGDRTMATLSRDDEVIEISIRATDLVALRAGINTWLTLLGVAEDADLAAASPTADA